MTTAAASKAAGSDSRRSGPGRDGDETLALPHPVPRAVERWDEVVRGAKRQRALALQAPVSKVGEICGRAMAAVSKPTSGAARA